MKENGRNVKGGRSMARTVAIGKQDFASIMENHYFFVDKQSLSGNGGNPEMM